MRDQAFRMLLRLTLLVVALTVGWAKPERACADCSDPEELARLRRVIRDQLTCDLRRLAGSGETCSAEEVSQCAQASPAELSRLVLGESGEDGVLAGDPGQWACQGAIVRGAISYSRRRLRALSLGRRATRAGNSLRQASRRCDGVPVGEIPRLGGSCGAVLVAGQPFDASPAMACLRASLERIAQELSATPLRPNIVVVLTDDQRWDTLDRMPRVGEELVRRGVLFSSGFTSTSLCSPDRASILSGRYAHNHGVLGNAGAFDFDPGDTIAVHLQAAGYATALIGKYMVYTGAALGTSIPPGWDEWRVFMDDTELYYDYTLNENGVPRDYGSEVEDYSTDVLAALAGEFVRAHGDQPFFLLYAPFAPHTSATPAVRHAGFFAGLAPWRPGSWLEEDIADKPAWVGVWRDVVSALPGLVPAIDQVRIRQLEALQAVDEAVEALALLLEKTGLADNTLLIFTSDNGYLWHEHWLELKGFPYEESIRVPLVVRYPLLAPVAREEGELVVHIDLAPTFAELAGIAGPRAMNGRSLVPLLRDGASPWRDDFLIEHFVGTNDPSAGVRTERWKYIETDADAGVTRELYDLESDPGELASMVDDPSNAALVAQLAERLAELRAE